jgi:hypothetical protein
MLEADGRRDAGAKEAAEGDRESGWWAGDG